MAISGIYAIFNSVSKHVYIGQAQDIEDRWKNHRHELRSGKHENKHLQHAWYKYGEEAFHWRIVECCTVELLKERENHYIKCAFRTKHYNIAMDATAPMRGLKHSPETRRKISEAARNCSPETRRKMSEAQKGRKHSPETRRKLSEVAKNCSPETRRKLSEARKRRPPASPETRRKLSEASKGNKSMLGKHHSLETRHKLSEIKKRMSVETRRRMSEAQKGKHHSPETRRKLSEATKRQHARKRAEQAIPLQLPLFDD